jgi:hypothetical protein
MYNKIILKRLRKITNDLSKIEGRTEIHCEKIHDYFSESMIWNCFVSLCTHNILYVSCSVGCVTLVFIA